MPNLRAERAARKRGDLSRFMVHLTRDDRAHFAPGGQEARKNFESILDTLEVRAYRAHCLHGRQVRKLGETVENLFKVCCFTETPLSELKHLLDVGWREINLEAFGFVFNRDFLERHGGQPVTYVNNYSVNCAQRAGYDRIFEKAAEGNFNGTMWKVLPFVNVMHDNHDFAWEREWRVQGDLDFGLNDLVCVLLPDDEEELRERMEYMGLAAISPDWTPDEMIGEIARQQKRTRKIWKDKFVKRAAKPAIRLVKAG